MAISVTAGVVVGPTRYGFTLPTRDQTIVSTVNRPPPTEHWSGPSVAEAEELDRKYRTEAPPPADAATMVESQVSSVSMRLGTRTHHAKVQLAR